MIKYTAILLGIVLISAACQPGGKRSAKSLPETVPPETMQVIYEEIKTPFKFGLIMVTPDPSRKMDCPSVFRKDGLWYMTYLVYDGRGYETWLAVSKDLIRWDQVGTIMSFSDSTDWDDDQKAGYIALQETEWEGDYRWQEYDGRYWMSYFGGSSKGYEAGMGKAWQSRANTKR